MRRWAIPTVVLAALLAACSGDDATDGVPAPGMVEVIGVWEDVEAARFEQVLRRFERATGVDVRYTSTAGRDMGVVLDERLAAGDPPELAFLPQPGLLRRYADAGTIEPIDEVVGDALLDDWSPEWRRLGRVGGRTYGLWFKAANKSLVWYDIATFERAGVVPPSSTADLFAVADAVVAGGTAAFAVSGVDEWTLTDWFENLYIRRAGPDRYDALAERRLAWTDRSIIGTLAQMARLLAPPLAAGGPDETFPGSVQLVFGEAPVAAMVMEGDFVAGAITGDTAARLGIEADVFPFPDPDPARRLVVGGGDAVVVLRGTPAAWALLRHLATPAAAETWAEAGGFISPNQDVDLRVYPDDVSRSIARALIEAGEGFRFDLSDLQSPAFGATTGAGMFGILHDFLRDPRDPAAVAARLEEAATAAMGPVSGR